MKIGIVGSRRRNTEADLLAVETALVNFIQENQLGEAGILLVSGGCPKGGDRFAKIIAKKYQFPIQIFKPDWERYRKAAGFIRNTDIARSSEVLIACVSPDRTGGTEDTIAKFRAYYPYRRLIIV